MNLLDFRRVFEEELLQLHPVFFKFREGNKGTALKNFSLVSYSFA